MPRPTYPTLSPRALNRATLARQLLLEPASGLDPTTALEQIGSVGRRNPPRRSSPCGHAWPISIRRRCAWRSSAVTRSRRRSCASRCMPSAPPTTAHCSRRSCRCSARPERFVEEHHVPRGSESSPLRQPSSRSRRAEALSCVTSWPAEQARGRSRRRSGGGSGVSCRSCTCRRRWAGPSRAGH